MTSWGAERIRDEAILIARILLVVLFVLFGWGKLDQLHGDCGLHGAGWGKLRIRVKSGHKASSNGSGWGLRGAGRTSMSRTY